MGIFTFNEVKWRSYKEEVREFTHANWARWKEEQPAWFTEEVMQRVPVEFIPAAARAELDTVAQAELDTVARAELDTVARGAEEAEQLGSGGVGA
jgi:hypothetical protein